MTPTGTRLAQAQMDGHRRVDELYQDLADAVEAEVLRWAAQDPAGGPPRLPLSARGAILVGIGVLLDRARFPLMEAVLETRQAAITAAEIGHEPAPESMGDLMQAYGEVYRTLGTDRGSVVSQTGAILVTGIAGGLGATEIARRVGQYFSPWFAPRRNVAGDVVRAGRQGAIHHWPGRAGMASQHARAVMLYQAGEAHALTMRRIAQRDNVYLRYYVSRRHREADECDQYAEEDSGLGQGVYTWQNAPKVPRHFGCFPAGTLVGFGDLERVYRRWYDGELVEVSTASGNNLRGTPNHPILTDRGWVPLGVLHEGDNVICRTLDQHVGSQNPDVQHVPTEISQVFDSLANEFRIQRVVSSRNQFHGDGGQDGEVDVVSIDGILDLSADAALGEPFAQDGFASANEPLLVLAAAGAGLNTFGGVDASAPGVMSGASPLLSLVSREAGREYDLGVMLRAGGNPGFVESSTNDGTGHAELAGDFVLQLAAVERRDQIVCVKRQAFRGHVYNLQTASGRYLANAIVPSIDHVSHGIVVHNCRCYLNTVERTTGALVQRT